MLKRKPKDAKPITYLNSLFFCLKHEVGSPTWGTFFKSILIVYFLIRVLKGATNTIHCHHQRNVETLMLLLCNQYPYDQIDYVYYVWYLCHIEMKDLKIFINLTRLNRPIGFLLLFWPCSWVEAYFLVKIGRNIFTI